MFRHFPPRLAACLTLAVSLPLHAQTGSHGGASPSSKAAAEAAGPNELFPPLPSLASLPPSSSQQLEEDAAPVTTARRSGKKTRRVIPHKAAETTVRVIVSDESLAYLATVERTLDDALRDASHDARDRHPIAGPVSIAEVR